MGVPAGLGFEVGARLGPAIAIAGGSPDLAYFASWWRLGLQSPPWRPGAFNPGHEVAFGLDGGKSSATVGLINPEAGHSGWSVAADLRYRAWAHPHWGSGVDLSVGGSHWTSAWTTDSVSNYRAPVWRPLLEVSLVLEAR